MIRLYDFIFYFSFLFFSIRRYNLFVNFICLFMRYLFNDAVTNWDTVASDLFVEICGDKGREFDSKYIFSTYVTFRI